MPRSLEFRQLQSRVAELRKHFLPKDFDPTGTYTDRQIDRARAFRLLAHAEIEWYLERVVTSTANKAYENWVTSGVITEPLLALLAYNDGSLDKVPDSKPTKGPPDIHMRVKLSRDHFSRYVFRENHGIRERQVIRLLFPVGIKEIDIDSTWLSIINSFGKNRGDFAHNSNKVSNPPDPQSELATVILIVDGLKHIDETLVAFQNK